MEYWNIEAQTGYKPITTFYEDFSIADGFGVDAIKDTYNKAFENWKNDYKYMTELVMVLNWKCWRWYETNEEYSKLYKDMYEELSSWCLDNFEEHELSYYFNITD